MENEPKLDKINDSLMNHMSSVVESGTTDGNTPLETIMKQSKNKGRSTQIVAPKEEVELLGYRIYKNDAFSALFIKLVMKNNPEIDALLTEANFQMKDLRGISIFPRPTPQIVSPTSSESK